MYPRLRIDITWRELARAAADCGVRGAPRVVGPTGSPVSLSVRSDFDLLLSAIDLPSGSEVLLSEVTVPHMPRIVHEHGYVPRAVPVDPRTLSVDVAEVESRLTPETKMLVVAHLFGSRMPLDDLAAPCQQHDILLVEDCAQALTTGNVERHPMADVSLYSFGPIKTATAPGGSIALLRDAELRARMASIANQWPEQSPMSYLSRVLKMGMLKLLSTPWLFTALVRAIEFVGGDADAFVGHSARGFRDDALFVHLRQRPCVALMNLVQRRLEQFDEQAIAQRTHRGWQLAEALPASAYVAGCDNATHTFWAFPVVCNDPAEAVRGLRAAGFDASQHSGLTVVDGDSSDHWFRHVVFVPQGVQVPAAKMTVVAQSLGKTL